MNDFVKQLTPPSLHWIWHL